jgi:hypothetical protein
MQGQHRGIDMRIIIAIAAASLAAAPASAFQKLGERTIPAEQILKEFGGVGVSDAEEERVIAEAASHPLGSVENPVRVGGPEGERSYLAKLSCGAGSTPNVGARAPGGVGAFGTVVAAFAVDCGAAAPGRTQIVIDMYHEEHVETRPPAGFTVAR